MVTKTHLSLQDIKAFLDHSDAYIRRAAAEYLEHCDLDQEAADLIFKGMKAYGASASMWVLGALPHAPFSTAQYQEILSLCTTEDEVTCASLHNVLCYAPNEFLKANLATLRSLPHMDSAVIEQMEHKISLESLTPAQIWADLKQISAEHSEDFEATFDYDVVSDKNRILAQGSVPSNDELLDLLLEPEVEGEWLEIFAIELLGMRRHVEAVPALVSLLEDSDAELLITHVTDALARINAPETVELIKERYLECDENPLDRMMLLDALNQLRLPEVKGLLQFILSRESDPANRTLAFMGLCQRFDAEGVKAAIRAARAGDFDPEFSNLRADVLAYADMLGLSLQEHASWSKERDLHEAELEKKFQEMMANEDRDEGDQTSHFTGGTFIRDASKIGRNDPCPCGSGKKYKSCCLITLQ